MKYLLAFLLLIVSATADAKEMGKPQICAAAIAAIMGKDPKIIKTTNAGSGIINLSYVRDDGTFWAYRCKIVGNEIIWASDGGRWRDLPEDEKITYQVATDYSKITIRQLFDDGSDITNEYTKDNFK